MRLILHYMKKYKLLVCINIISVFGFVLTELGIPTILADMIDFGVSTGNKAYLFKEGFKMAGISILGVSGTILLGYCCSKISTNITHDIRKDMYEKIQNFSHEEYNKFKIASLITRVNNDAFQIQLFVNVLLRTALMTPVMLITSLFLTYRSSVQLFSVIFATIPLIILGVIFVAKVTGPISERQQAGLDDMNRISRESLTGVRVVRAFNRQHTEQEKFLETNEFFTKNSKSLFMIMQLTQPVFFLVMNIAVCRIFYFGANLVSQNALEVGRMVAFLDYLFHAMMSMMFFCTVFMMYPRANVSAKRINSVLNKELSLVNDPKAEIVDEDVNTISFNNIGYEKEGKKILDNISFDAKTGQTIAIVGSTGSGKSTLSKLIPRLFDCTSGEIMYNNTNIKDFDVERWREKIGFVAQKAFLFKGTIRSNVCFGKSDATDDEIIEALDLAQATEFVASKEDGIDSVIEENAANLSGGQKQRLSIARAVIRKPDIYIFDDAFSALDFKTDAALRKALKPVTKNSIMFIVAQRISTIMDADKILVLNHGKLEAVGTHEDLMENCPLYKNIAESQIGEEAIDYGEEA
ncbi:ABC transporter ATP-binding protein [Peptacetobacter sp.]|uniref:ABC transporter ATP-binding protein n=1 Tax=Peptacetobacter sp. TaxID=2991975 RepID=UPI002E7AAB81|nr:ABC transporter ATP-binding protein [Peptacetobacter sp.]MEE0451800.1 ABC transporter ATP-binding protein [Peptacetobacter sp.]